MPNYSKDIFVIPLTNDDISVKIRDNNNFIRIVIKDTYCQLKLDGANILIKQKSDSRVTKLDFTSSIEAIQALPILEAALNKMSANIKRINAGAQNGILVYESIIPTDNTVYITLPFIPDLVIEFFVNGVAIPNHSSNYSIVSNTIHWTSSQYTLDTGDIVTLIYS